MPYIEYVAFCQAHCFLFVECNATNYYVTRYIIMSHYHVTYVRLPTYNSCSVVLPCQALSNLDKLYSVTLVYKHNYFQNHACNLKHL